MKYVGNAEYRHDEACRIGVLLCNLGTPATAETRSVRRYLAEFLSDPRVIELPAILWQLILHGIILRTRPARSAEAYRKVWSDEGSPLLSLSQSLCKQLHERLTQTEYNNIEIELAMRYGQPSVASALEKLFARNVQRLLILPLYPQYSAATVGSTFDAIAAVLRRQRLVPELHMVTHYHDEPAYISAIADSIRKHQQQHGVPQRLLFSFHGLPEHYFLAGDPYHCECHKSARLIAENLGLEDTQWSLSFQSRFGPRRWLHPYTDVSLQAMPKEGIRNVQVVCPGFSIDCLETLEEIQLQNRDFFLEEGGERFSYIPALNDTPAQVDLLEKLTIRHCSVWQAAVESDTELAARAARAEKAKQQLQEMQ